MGLYAALYKGNLPEELVFPVSLSGGFSTEVVVYVDYTPAFEAAAETFVDVATSLVPVDTGYLQSTIYAGFDSTSAEFFADAEYAQYVEYGTWKMAAQPYFTPALEEAQMVWSEVAQEILMQAEYEAYETVEGFNMAAGSIDALISLIAMLFWALIQWLIEEFFKLINGDSGAPSANSTGVIIT